MQKNFPSAGSHLERYASMFPAVEINTSFYRSHRPVTYARWRDAVPESFRFSVKIPKIITHELRLQNVDEYLGQFINEVSNLQHKLGCLLLQLPPSLQYDALVAARFFDKLRTLADTPVVCEARHVSWFEEEAAAMLASAKIAYVFADPHPVDVPVPDIDAEIVYLRLHGSPVMYHSGYPEAYLEHVGAVMRKSLRAGKQAWCIFDNTASGAAVPDALSLLSRYGNGMECYSA